MKFFILLLCLTPLILAAPDKRSIKDELKHLVTKLLDSGIVDTTCKTTCHAIAGLLGFLCNPACTEAIKLAHGR